MQFYDRTVLPAAINLTAQRFRISTDRPFEDLAESIKRIGLIHPPLLVEKGEAFTVVSGFRRIEAVNSLGWPSVPVRVTPSGASEMDLALIAIADNSLQRPLNPIETSRALNLLGEFGWGRPEFSARAAALSLPANPKFIEKYQRLSRLPQFVQEMVATEVISFSIALDLEEMLPSACKALAEIFNELRLSLGKQRDILTLTSEIGRREEKPLEAILGETEIARIRADDNLDRTQKGFKIRAYFRRRRFPTLVQAENQFRAFAERLPLGANLVLMPPSDFEGTEHTIRLRFNSLEELDSQRAVLAGLMTNDHFKRYWTTLRGPLNEADDS